MTLTGKPANLNARGPDTWNEISPPAASLAFSLPYLLSYFLQTLYGVADLFIIG